MQRDAIILYKEDIIADSIGILINTQSVTPGKKAFLSSATNGLFPFTAQYPTLQLRSDPIKKGLAKSAKLFYINVEF